MVWKSSIAALILAAGLWVVGCSSGHGGGGCGSGCCGSGGPPPAAPAGPVKPAAGYYCPMHAQVTSMGPDKCRICGMQLVPRE